MKTIQHYIFVTWFILSGFYTIAQHVSLQWPKAMESPATESVQGIAPLSFNRLDPVFVTATIYFNTTSIHFNTGNTTKKASRRYTVYE